MERSGNNQKWPEMIEKSFRGLFASERFGSSILLGSTKKNDTPLASRSFWVPPPERRLHPSVIKMLGQNEFALRQGFRQRRKRSYGANPPPRRAGPHFFLASILLRCLNLRKITAISAVIFRLTTEIPQTDFSLDHLTGTPFQECPSYFVYSGPEFEGDSSLKAVAPAVSIFPWAGNCGQIPPPRPRPHSSPWAYSRCR